MWHMGDCWGLCSHLRAQRDPVHWGVRRLERSTHGGFAARASRRRDHWGNCARTPQTQRPPREPEQSVDQLVQQVRPHVPALLARDGNEAVTRVQLREILRREGLKGGRNDRLSLVLQELRSDNTSKTRSTAR